MMKPGISVFVVDSVERAIKFYTEKLLFDIVGLFLDPESKHVLRCVFLRKGKCFVGFRVPDVEELADFSVIKRSSTRGAGVYVPMKKGLDKYYERCEKKKVPSLSSIEPQSWGDRTFSLRDPFGIKLVFAEPIPNFEAPDKNMFCGMLVERADEQTQEEMIRLLKGFGILRRAGKKYSKLWMKERFGKAPR